VDLNRNRNPLSAVVRVYRVREYSRQERCGIKAYICSALLRDAGSECTRKIVWDDLALQMTIDFRVRTYGSSAKINDPTITGSQGRLKGKGWQEPNCWTPAIAQVNIVGHSIVASPLASCA
jgi:hypothetical protein